MEALNKVKNAINNWWILMILGILFILGSFYIYQVPEESYHTLSIFFAVIVLFDGIGSIYLSISNRDILKGWGWQLAGGIISTLIGIILFMHPALSMVILPIFVGFWILIKGGAIIGTSFDLKSYGIDNWGWILVLGILIAVFGFAMVLNPLFGGKMVLLLTALSFILLGIAMIMISLRLRKVKSTLTKLKDFPGDKIDDLKNSVQEFINNPPEDIKDTLRQIKDKINDATK
jgi:uncharacterized membrane protein HdeD (DUF308 family)